MPDEMTGMSTEDTGAGGAPSSPSAPSTEPGGAGGAPTGAAPSRPDFLLEGYNSAEEQARALHQFHQQHGSLQEMQQLREWYAQNYDDLSQWYQQRQQPQQQPQPQLPKSLAWLEQSKDPQFLAAFQMAQMNGGQLPDGYQNRDQVMQQLATVQQFWDNAYANPEQMILDLFQLPSVQQAIQQMSGKAIQPIQQQVHHQHVSNLVQTYGPQLQKMHPLAQELFNAAHFGTGEEAAKKALAYNQKLMAALNNGQQQPKPPAKEEAKNDSPTNGKPAGNATSGVKDRRAANDAAIKEHAKEAARARIALMNGKR